MVNMAELHWIDADARRPRVWLYLGSLYIARIKALRPGQWWYSLASPDFTEQNHGSFASADDARTACENAIKKALR